jgi:hypothetical protein
LSLKRRLISSCRYPEAKFEIDQVCVIPINCRYLLSSSLNSRLDETFNRTFTAAMANFRENRGIEEAVQRLSTAQ